MSNANQDRDRNGRFTEGANVNKPKAGIEKNKAGSHAASDAAASKDKTDRKW